MYSSAFLNCFAPPLHWTLDELGEGELADDENMELPDVRRRRKNEANESPKRNGEQRTSTSPSGTSTYYALEGSNSWREMMTDHAIMTQ
ncbi:hypothetical protein I308_102283 [Cryptococcus tetragattii IND107]|uniref:Uncharacterized protein n=1 Tax=Cryptococcus tetragattii IND107 TaxID=1296105 RepID=A0ABR3BZE8_9TREE